MSDANRRLSAAQVMGRDGYASWGIPHTYTRWEPQNKSESTRKRLEQKPPELQTSPQTSFGLSKLDGAQWSGGGQSAVPLPPALPRPKQFLEEPVPTCLLSFIDVNHARRHTHTGGGVEKNSWYRRTAFFWVGTPGGGGGDKKNSRKNSSGPQNLKFP